MTPLTVAAIAFVLSLLMFGFAFWTPIYAIPLALVFLVGFGLAEYARRQRTSRGVRELRAQGGRGAPGRETEFTDRDRETLYER
jgi:hypothetical protein